jgi:hypothetical protein
MKTEISLFGQASPITEPRTDFDVFGGGTGSIEAVLRSTPSSSRNNR